MFALDPQVLDDAARRIDGVVASLACLDVTSALTEAAAEVPGSATAVACGWTSAGLDAALDCWAEHLHGLCEAARAVARDAAETDAEVAAALTAPLKGVGP